MMTSPRLLLLLTACAVSSACGLFFDTDELRQSGAAGDDGGGGAQSAVTTGDSGGSVPGKGGSGNGGNGGSPPVGCDAPGYCGPGSSCEPDGFCTVVSTEAPEEVWGLAFIRSTATARDDGHVVAHSSSVVGLAERLSTWPLAFTQGELPLPSTSLMSDPGVGFIAAGGADHVYYFGQGQNCDVDAGNDSCITVCSIDSSGIDCFPPRVLTGGSHLLGAVLVPNNDPSQNQLYFLVQRLLN
jgi:hypothetical protein